MQNKTVLRATLAAMACAVAFCASDVWNSKESPDWTADDINRILTDSPWAKQVNASFDSAGRGGGIGGPGGGGGGGMGRGGGMGGGGMGYPGGGMGGGGIGGGMGGGGRGGMGRGGGGMGGPGGGGGQSRQSMSVLVRWDSATPIQQALARRGDAATPAPEPKAAGEASAKHYVITVVGLRTQGRRVRSDSDSSTGADGETRGTRDPDLVREELMSSTELVLKGRNSITPDDIRMTGRDSASGIQFFFPLTMDPISLDDKDVTFQTHLGSAKVEKKFNLKEMKFKGKLEL